VTISIDSVKPALRTQICLHSRKYPKKWKEFQMIFYSKYNFKIVFLGQW